MRNGDWTPVQWFNPNLAKAAAEISNISNLRLTGDLHHWKIKNATFYTTFKYEHSDNGNCFCTISEDVMQTVGATPESLAMPKEGKESSAERAYAEADHVLAACRFSTTSSRLAAVYSEQPAIMGGAFTPIGVVDKVMAKVYAAFLNSSFGIIQLLNRRNKKLTYITFETGQMKTLLLPDPEQVDLAPLLEAFEKVKDNKLERLAKCNVDPARRILDQAVAKAIDFDPAICDQWREWLSQEPTITNRRYESNS